MDQLEKARRLKSMLTQVAPGDNVESIPRSAPVPAPMGAAVESFSALEGMAPDEDPETVVERAIEKLAENREEDLTTAEVMVLEAIVMPQNRPVVFARGTSYDNLPQPWLHLNAAAVKNRISPLFRSIARIELPNSPQIPFGGTGFVVGPDLMFTNRHVARLFSEGVGLRVRYEAGDAAVDFNRRVDSASNDRSALFKVVKVEMVHPFWDMALVRVNGLSERVQPLPLSVLSPEELVDREVVVIGYPARDDRNDLALQDRIFARTYNVKRLQPGKIRPRARIRSFETTVNAMTHDCSTLGGNSGSAVVDLRTGQVVGLHFAGEYLRANYAVPMFELARDRRVTRMRLNFGGSVAPTTEFDAAWRRVGVSEAAPDSSDAGSSVQSPEPQGTAVMPSGTAQYMIPIYLSVSVGQPSATSSGSAAAAAPAIPGTEALSLKTPIIFGGLENRDGYRSGFLELKKNKEVPMPPLTSAGKKIAAKLEDGSTELKYHKFSVVMHKERRLALFTAANVDWRVSVRLINGKKPSRAELRGFKDGLERWVTDWRIDEKHQLPDIFFTKDQGMFDKGHLVRRDDVCWGETFKDIQKANGDTYHTTNCSPQTMGFNQAPEGDDNWGDLENLVQAQTKAEKASLFSGPVLDEDDPMFEGRGENGSTLMVRIPRRYWKIIVVKGAKEADVYGFVLEQDLSALEMNVPAEWRRHMKSVDEIEEMLQGLVDLSWLKQYDRFESDEGARIAEMVR